MQISPITSGQSGPTGLGAASGVAAATATLNDPRGGLADQLKAYQALASQWRQAGPSARASLAQVLTDSPFAQKVHATLNAFTRAAWAGPDAVPPAPEAQMVKAFDGLSEGDRQIVAAMQVDGSGAPAYKSAADYRAKLQADLDAAQAAAAEPAGDTVTLSAAAQAHLAGGAAPATGEDASGDTAAPVHPEMAAALAAYTRAPR